MSSSGGRRDAVKGVLEWVDATALRIAEARPTPRSVLVRCPEDIAEVGFLLDPPGNIAPTIFIPHEGVSDVRLVSLPDVTERSEIVTETPDGFRLDLAPLLKANEKFLLTVSRQLGPSEGFDSLVDRKWQADSSRSGSTTGEAYWVHAALKDPTALETAYGNVDLRDFEVAVDVGIYEKLRSALPPSFVRRTDALIRFVRERERGRRVKSMLEYSRLRGSKGTSDDIARIAELRAQFTTHFFREFVEVSHPFRFASAAPSSAVARAEDIFDIPKFVQIATRTNIDVRHPVARGELIYHPSRLFERLQTILTK